MPKALKSWTLVIVFASLWGIAVGAPGDKARPEVATKALGKIWVVFRDKGPASPRTQRAFEDAPLYAPYLAELKGLGFKAEIALRWQNRVSGYIDASRVSAIRAMPGVAGIESMPWRRRLPSSLPSPQALAKPGQNQVASRFGVLQAALGGIGLGPVRDSLLSRGQAPGAGVRIAVLDADFALGSAAFRSLWREGRIADQFDFVANKPQAATQDFFDSHGASVLSIIGGDMGDLLQGAAPAATYLLYRTENDASETYVEEDYLAAAMERAVDSGAQVVNISLGYRYDFDQEPEIPYSAMNGRTRPSSLAVLMAARRNVLVTVSVGNIPLVVAQGATLQAPSDADSILAVGITDAAGRRCGYSCWGPTSDGRVKPDLVGLGPEGCTVPMANPSVDSAAFRQGGTSFASPALAGAAALLCQAFPRASAMQIRSALLRSATFADAPHDSLGYGLARADGAWQILAGDTSIGPTPQARRYGPRKLAYPGGEVAWVLPRLPLSESPRGIYDMRGQWHAVIASPDDQGNIRVQPRRPLSRGVYVLP